MESAKVDDPRGRKRTVPFQILALGLSRSGTESLCKALTILGIPTYHGWRSLENHFQAVLWTEAIQAKYENKGKQWTRDDFDQILGNYSACTDLPCAMFATELMEAYPEAKVILNQRSRDAWYTSLVNSASAIQKSWFLWVMMSLDWEARVIRRCWVKANGHAFRWSIERNAKQVYIEHGAMVRGAAPPDRFLEYDPRQGWEPICKFLDLPIPKEPFPTGNVADEFHKKIEGCLKPRFFRSFRNIALIAMSTIGAGAYAYMHPELLARVF